MPSYSIEIQNTVSRYKISLTQLHRVASKILKTLRCKQAALSILLVSDRKIQPINKRYLNHDCATDVISFPYKVRPLTGDLVISLDTTARQAKDYGNSFDYELCFYICHGILHLMGHSDKTAKQAAWMDRKQKAVLKKIGIKNGDSKNTRARS